MASAHAPSDGPQMQLAPPRKTFAVETLLNGNIDVLSLLHYLHEKQGTGLRDLLINMLYDLTPAEIDSILPQLVHLFVRWDQQQALYLSEFFLYQCAHSLHFTLKVMWILHAEEAHAAPNSVAHQRIGHMLKLAEMAHVNSEIPTTITTKSGRRPGAPRSREIRSPTNGAAGSGAGGAGKAPHPGAMKRSSTETLKENEHHIPQQSSSATASKSPPPALHRPGNTPSHQPLHSTPNIRAMPGGGFARTGAATQMSGGASLLSPFPAPVNRTTRMVQVTIVPAEISAPLNALVTVKIQLVFEREPVAPTATIRTSPQSKPHHPQKFPPLQRLDGPAAAFTSQNSWKPVEKQQHHPVQAGHAGHSLSTSPPANAGHHVSTVASHSTAPHPSIVAGSYNQSRPTRNASPAQVRSPSSSGGSMLGGSPRSDSEDRLIPGSSSPKDPAHQTATTPSPGGHTKGMLSAEEIRMQSLEYQTPASATNPKHGAAADDDADDVDWPAADQDIPEVIDLRSPREEQQKVIRDVLARTTAPAAAAAAAPNDPLANLPRKYMTLGAALTSRRDALSPRSPDSAKLSTVDEPILFHLLSKQVRSEYFNLELLLFSTFHDLSEALTKVPIAERNKVLREQLRAIDETIIRGLYLPLIPHSSNSENIGSHYKILRILPEDCWSLASRDKAPFLMHMEISYITAPDGSRMTCYDANTYTAYKSDDAIMRDALMVEGAGVAAAAAAASGSSGGTPNHPPTPDTAAATAKKIADMNNNTPNSKVTGQEGGGWGTPNASTSANPSTPQQSIQLDKLGSSNLTSNPAANVQANGLNIVADASDRLPEGAPAAAIAAAVSELSISDSASRLLRVPSLTARDAEGRAITRSRSSSSIAPGEAAQVSASLSRESSDNVSKAAASSTSRHGTAGSVDLSGQTAAIRQSASDASAQSASVPCSPRDTSRGIDISSQGSHAHHSSESHGHGNGAHPEAMAHQSQSLGQLVSKPSSAASAKVLTTSQTVSSISTGSASQVGKVPRTVPQANPFRPRRSSSYQAGPTLCDIDFRQLSSAFGESFQAKKRRIRATSPFAASVPESKWDLVSVIFKGGDDLRQEVLAMQFITAFDRIFRAARLPLYLKPYSVVITSSDSGLIETIPDAVSIDSLKKRLFPNWTCLTDFYAAYFGGAELAHIIEGKEEFDRKHPMDCGVVTYQTALRNFVESMAGYSVVSFLLQIKDRHNGNIMITRTGSIVHIDYGFMLSNSPGGNWGWESAPFKLTQEYVDVMGGVHSDLFGYFRMLVTRGFLEARSHVDEFLVLCDVHAKTSQMPCFSGPAALAGENGVIDAMRERFAMHLKSESEVEAYVSSLIDQSIDNWRTRKYDRYQKLVSGIL